MSKAFGENIKCSSIWGFVQNNVSIIKNTIKGGYLDFSHLTELEKNIYITEIYMITQYKSSTTKIIKLRKIYFLMVLP